MDLTRVVATLREEDGRATLLAGAMGETGLVDSVTAELGGEWEYFITAIDDDGTLVWVDHDNRLHGRSPSGAKLEQEVPGWSVIAGHPVRVAADLIPAGLKTLLHTRSLLMSGDGRLIAVNEIRDQVDAIFSTESGEELKAFAKRHEVRALSRDGRFVGVRVKKDVLRIYSTDRFKKVSEISFPCLSQASFSPGGTRVALTSHEDNARIGIYDVTTGALLAETVRDHHVKHPVWTERFLVHEGGLIEMPVGDDAARAETTQVETVKRPRSKAKSAKKTLSQELGLPFELEFTHTKAALNKAFKRNSSTSDDTGLDLIEAAIVHPSYVTDGHYRPFGDDEIPLAAAILLRNPCLPVRLDHLLAKSDPHLEAVRPLLDERGRGRLACALVATGAPLDEELRAALADFVVNHVWVPASSNMPLKIDVGDLRLGIGSPFETIEAFCRQHAGDVGFEAAMKKLWDSGRATSIRGFEPIARASIDTLLTALEPYAQNARVQEGAWTARLDAGVADDPDEVVAKIAAGWTLDPETDLHRLAYAAVVAASAGRDVPERIAAAFAEATLASLTARALAALAGPDAPPLAPVARAWTAAATGDWDGTLALLPAALALPPGARRASPSALNLQQFLVDRVPPPRAHDFAPVLRQHDDAGACRLLLRAMESGAEAPAPSWFVGAAWSRACEELLATVAEDIRREAITLLLADKTPESLTLVSAYDRAAAVRVAVEDGNTAALSICTGETVGVWLPVVFESIRDSKAPEEIVAALRYRIPAEDHSRLAAAIARTESLEDELARLAQATAGPKMRVALFIAADFASADQPRDAGVPAKSSTRATGGRKGETPLFTLALDDVPELRSAYPGQDAIAIFAGEASKPSRVPTRIEEGAEVPSSGGCRVLVVELPVDFFSSKAVSDYRALRDALPYWAAAVPLVTAPDRPLMLLQDAWVGLELERDEGYFLVFANGASRYRG